MEHSERHHQTARTIESTIRRLELSQTLLIQSSHVQLFEQLQARHPEEQPEMVLLDEAPSVASLVFPQDTLLDIPEKVIDEPVFPETSFHRLMRPDQIVAAAEEALALRQHTEETERVIECFNCRRYGRTQPSCYFCKGIGEIQRHPRLRLINHLTNQHADLTIDLPQMLVDGTVTPEWELQTSTTAGRLRTIGALGIALTPLFTKAAQSIGIDTQHTAVEDDEQYLDPLESYSLRINGLHMTYDHTTEKMTSHTIRSTKHEPVTPLIVLSHLEANALRHFNAGLYTGHDNELLARPPLNMRPLRQTTEALQDLTSAIETLGGSLWARWAHYGNDAHGIEFCIKWAKQPDTKLACEENVRLGIENSWIRLQRIIKGLEDPYEY